MNVQSGLPVFASSACTILSRVERVEGCLVHGAQPADRDAAAGRVVVVGVQFLLR
jgi:hypothetical protein